jgi:hypothetical protein
MCAMRKILVLALLVLVPACGGDDSESSETTTAPTTARATAEVDKARAGRIVLTGADLPGYTEDVSAEDDPEADRVFAACVQNDPVLTAEPGTNPRSVDGSDFDKSDAQSVSSSATIAETEDQARAAMGRLREQGVLDCLGTSFRDELRDTLGSEATLRSVDIDELQVAAVGDESVGLRLVATVAVQGETVRVTSDITAIRRERAVAFLLTNGINSVFPQAERTELANKMAGRMGP